LGKKTERLSPKEKFKNKKSDSQSSADDGLSVGSSNAFEATENPQKDIDRELSDEELDDLLDGDK
jgi:hypothetical protein